MLVSILLQFSLFLGGSLGCPGSDWAEAGASCYHRSPQPISWREGNDYCQQQGGFMVEVNSEAEQQLITGMYGSENYHWIGLNSDPTWNLKAQFPWSGLTDWSGEWRWRVQSTHRFQKLLHASQKSSFIVLLKVTDNNKTF